MLTSAETRVQPPVVMPPALCFNELIWQHTLKLAETHVPVTAAGPLCCSLRCNGAFHLYIESAGISAL